jgi:putative ABC transport system permease protein
MVRGAATVAWQTLRAHKLRTCLTCMSLALAVLALVTVDAAAQVASSAVVAQVRVREGLPETWQTQIRALPQAEARAIQAQTILQRILAPNGGSSVLLARASGGLSGAGVTIVAMQGDLRSIRPFRVTSGGWLRFGVASISPQIVLNEPASRALGSGAARLTLGGQRDVSARVIGTVDDSLSDAVVYVQLDDVEVWADPSPQQWSIDLLGHSATERPGEASAAMDYALRSVELAADPPVRIDQIGIDLGSLEAIRLAFLVVAAVGLLVGAIGILNIGLVSLHERVDEIGLRRATGATALQIGLSVIMEAVLAAAVAACVAILVARLALAPLTDLLLSNAPLASEVGFPYQTALFGVLVAGFAGFAGGIIPAVKAARMDIANVMRA